MELDYIEPHPAPTRFRLSYGGSKVEIETPKVQAENNDFSLNQLAYENEPLRNSYVKTEDTP